MQDKTKQNLEIIILVIAIIITIGVIIFIGNNSGFQFSTSKIPKIKTSSGVYSCGDPLATVTFTYNGKSVTYGTVYNSKTEECWLDRNLGASRVATTFDDTEAYGDLFQWGRQADGHQLRTSEAYSTDTNLKNQVSQTDVNRYGKFLMTFVYPYDWANSLWITRWTNEKGNKTNADPCPDGWRVPTKDELEAEIESWQLKNATGSFSNGLKLPASGYRYFSNDKSIWHEGLIGNYWSSSADIDNEKAWFLDIGDSYAIVYGASRAFGFSVRCIKD